MGSAGSKDERQFSEAVPSTALKTGLITGYASLIAVNLVYGKGTHMRHPPTSETSKPLFLALTDVGHMHDY